MTAFLKNLPVQGLGGIVYLSEAPYPPRVLFGVVKQFVGSESVQRHMYTVAPVDALHTTRSPQLHTV
jgi:hypothetical protein